MDQILLQNINAHLVNFGMRLKAMEDKVAALGQSMLDEEVRSLVGQINLLRSRVEELEGREMAVSSPAKGRKGR